MSPSDSNAGSRFLLTSSQGPRAEQQDAGICLHDAARGTALLVVCDGVGGRSGGRIASQKVTTLARELWEKRKGSLEKPADDLAELCQLAHEDINREGAKLGISPRTTIVALYLTPTHAWWIHSGDSRLYRFRGGQLVERTEDHSLLEIMVQRGAVKEEEMGRHPDQNTLLQSLGGEEFMEPATGAAEITPDDGFLLCTDGFWERTRPEEMAELVFADIKGASGLLAQVVERAVERNGPKGDNVTVAVALPARAKPAAQPVAPVLTRQQKFTLVAGAVLLLIVSPALYFWPEEKKPADTATTAPVSANAPAPGPAAADAPLPQPMPPAKPAAESSSPAARVAEKPVTPEAPAPAATSIPRATAIPVSAGPTPIAAVPVHPAQAPAGEAQRAEPTTPKTPASSADSQVKTVR